MLQVGHGLSHTVPHEQATQQQQQTNKLLTFDESKWQHKTFFGRRQILSDMIDFWV
jgi:hypothetical protein